MPRLSSPDRVCPFPIPAAGPRTKGGRRRYSHDQPQAFSRLETLHERARAYSKATRAVLTVDAYRRDWAGFTEWCEVYDLALRGAPTWSAVRPGRASRRRHAGAGWRTAAGWWW